MIHSDNFIKVKKLHFEEGLPFTSVNIKFEKGGKISAIITLGGKEIVEGEEADFVDIAMNIKSTIRNGKKELIDLSSLPVNNTQSYYNNVDIFVTTDDEKHKIQMLIQEMAKDPLKVPSYNIKKGIHDIAEKKFDSIEAKEILTDYFKAKAFLIFQIANFNAPYQKIKDKRKYSSDFNTFTELSDNIFREYLRNNPTLKALEIYEKRCIVDIEFAIRNFWREMMNQQQVWDSLYKTTGGKLPGEMGIHLKLSDYAHLYEIVKDLLRDLVSILDKDKHSVNLSNESEVINYLKNNGYLSLVSFLEPQLRHGRAHVSIDYDPKTQEVLIHDNIYKNRILKIKTNYQEILDKCKKIEELAMALILNHLLNELVILFMVIDSPDFKFYVVENKAS